MARGRLAIASLPQGSSARACLIQDPNAEFTQSPECGGGVSESDLQPPHLLVFSSSRLLLAPADRYRGDRPRWAGRFSVYGVQRLLLISGSAARQLFTTAALAVSSAVMISVAPAFFSDSLSIS